MLGVIFPRIWSTASAGQNSVVLYTPPGSATVNAIGGDQMAVEYDLFIPASPAPPVGAFSALDWVSWDYNDGSAHGWGTGPLNTADQEGLGYGSAASIDAVIARATGKWYHRVIRLPAGSSVSYYNWRIGPRAVTATATSATYVQALMANVRVTNFRETVQWLWRDGMTAPVANTTANAVGDCAVSSVTAPQFPTFNAAGAGGQLDDISHQRKTGGRLNSWLFWDNVRRAFRLSRLRVDAAGLWDIETFYEMFRREAFVYQHQSNLPGMWCRFASPPKHQEAYIGGKLYYDMEIEFQQR